MTGLAVDREPGRPASCSECGGLLCVQVRGGREVAKTEQIGVALTPVPAADVTEILCASCGTGLWPVRFRESQARRAEFDEGNSVRFRTRSHGANAGNGGYSGHGGREVIQHNDGERECYFYSHRLALFAWTPEMDIDDLWAVPEDQRTADPRTDKMEAHHHMPVPWLNAEWNMEWKSPEDHGREESRRKERNADGTYAGPRAPGELVREDAHTNADREAESD